MAWTWTESNLLDNTITVAWANETRNAIKQLAADLYLSPSNAGDGSSQLAAPLEGLVYVGSVSGNSTTGVTVTLPASYAPAAATDYEVFLSWQGDPGGNGSLWVEKTTSNFVIKHYGSKTGVTIAYQIVRKTA